MGKLAGSIRLAVFFFATSCILVCSSASAAGGHGPFSTFTTSNAEFAAPAGVAVDNSTGPSKGDVYVVDIGHGRLVKFNSEGVEENFSALGTPEIAAGFTQLRYVAVDNSSGSSKGDIYISDTEGHVVYKYNPAGELVSKIEGSVVGASQFEPTGLAVNPKNGDLFIGGLQPSVVYTVEEESPAHWKLLDTFGQGEVAGIDSLAADSEGNVYVTSQEQSVAEFNSAGTPVLCPAGGPHEGTNVVDGVAPQSVAVDPSNNEIYVGENAEKPSFKVAVYSAPCSSPIAEFGEGDFGSSGSYGIAVSGATHAFYGSQIGGSVADLFPFGSTPEPPPMTTGHQVEGLTATLEGELLGEETAYEFAYGTNGSCEGGIATAEVDDEETGVPVSTKVTGLEPSTEYTFCLVEKNAFGAVFGNAKSFITEGPPPLEAETGEATEITETTVDLDGKINANGRATYYFEYGTAPCGVSTCGSKTQEEGPLHGTAQEPIGPKGLTGLTPGTTYYYWAVAKNAAGVVRGEQRTFRTLAEGVPSGLKLNPATEVKTTSARLNGEFDPQSKANYYFEYGTEPCVTAKTKCAKTAEEGPLNGFAEQSVSAVVTGLIAEETYYYRLVGTNSKGTIESGEKEFTVGFPGEIRTEPAEEVTETSAYLSAEFDANGSATYYFEYGTEPCGLSTCGAKTNQEGPVVGETRKVVESIKVESLQPGTTYYYRVVALDHRGTKVLGSQRSFTTLPEPKTTPIIKPPPVTTVTKASSVITPPPITPSVSVVKTKVRGDTVIVTFEISVEGEVGITGPDVKKTTAVAAKSFETGTHELKVTLTAKGKSARKHHRKTKITVTLKIGEQTVTSSKTIKL